jgi:hypothetical protein
MDRTANQSTSLRTPWREALKRAGSFDELRPYLHMGQIPAHHGGLYALSNSNQHSGPGILRPEKWAHAYEDRAGRRVIFITNEVVFGQFVREEVFAYASGIELDSAAFDTFFPVAGLPPAEHPRPLTTQAEPVVADPAPAGSAVPPVSPGGRPADRDLVLEETEPVIVDPAPPVKGGRPTDRDLVLEEADWRLRQPQIPKTTLAAFARELHEWLDDHGMYRAVKTGEVMQAETIEDHVRSLWNAHRRA